MDKSPEQISGMFNRIASSYDLLNDCMTGGLHRVWKQTACQALNLKAGDHVLDVCTGTGDLAAKLSAVVGPGGRVTGVDFSREMLETAKKRFQAKNNITWIEGDALYLPFSDNTFDGAMISFGLRNVASIPQAIAQMVRVTKPGGWVVNLDTASDCKNPLFWLYFSKLMPLLGRAVSADPKAYGYLCRSTQTFMTPQEIVNTLTQAGLIHTKNTYFGLGSVAMQVGQKPTL